MENNLRNKVWLIESRNPNGAVAMGSAVVVWLRESSTKKQRKYLITCAHLVKDFLPSGEGYIATGPLRKSALCRPNNAGFVQWNETERLPIDEDDGIWVADVIDPFGRPAKNWSEEDCSPEKDWVLLDVVEKSFQRTEAATIADEFIETLSIIGFPDGSGKMRNGTVIQNRVSTGYKVDRSDSNPQILRPEGAWPVGPGMSGGGVFDANENLIAIYRGQDSGHLSTASIKVKSIRNELLNPSNPSRRIPSCDFVVPAATIKAPAQSAAKTGTPTGMPTAPTAKKKSSIVKWIVAFLVLASILTAMAMAHLLFEPGDGGPVESKIDYRIKLLPNQMPNSSGLPNVPMKADVEALEDVVDTAPYSLKYENQTDRDFWLFIANCDLLYPSEQLRAANSNVRFTSWIRIPFPANCGVDGSTNYNYIEPGSGLHFLVLRDGLGTEIVIGAKNLFAQETTTLVVEEVGGKVEHKFIDVIE